MLFFNVMDLPLLYKGMLGGPFIKRFASMHHRLYNIVKIPGPRGVITLVGNGREAVCCIQGEARKVVAARACEKAPLSSDVHILGNSPPLFGGPASEDRRPEPQVPAAPKGNKHFGGRQRPTMDPVGQ